MLRNLLFVLFIFISLFSDAQYKGTSIHVFQANQQTTPVTPAHIDSVKHIDRNCLKWNWSVITRGEFLINYEIYLTGNLSAELGIGITYEDFLYETTYNQTSANFASNSAYGAASPSLGGEGGLRYYPRGYNNMEGIFLEATLSYRAYSFPNSNFTPISGKLVPGYDFFDCQFKFGYVTTSWFNDFVTEFYIGIGIRNATVRSYESVLIQSPNSPYGYEEYQPQTVHVTYPQPLLGFKFGYAF
jgi:hypothetical protein